MTAHTPGPWAAKRCICGHTGCSDFWIEPPGKFLQGSGFKKADAVLIVAAPKMKAALEDAESGLGTAMLTARCNCSAPGGGFVCTPHKALASIRAAIAEAEGRK